MGFHLDCDVANSDRKVHYRDKLCCFATIPYANTSVLHLATGMCGGSHSHHLSSRGKGGNGDPHSYHGH